ncbi:DUF1134 domain-containing protein [Methylobrevis pamukkalensis]|uniref:DUF1134 domain-containing protein n=1 Tax=Methylobrevis pamukkalensis TaxID=1439726 RepID=A0A1E3GZV4_9HYPH|nr:DUF1134 domain-containing protein [Methylobrevis pamukkalensis]ODN68861.1 hypothetical protein A6302_03840 [Methylobrevis pamukkalensis]
MQGIFTRLFRSLLLVAALATTLGPASILPAAAQQTGDTGYSGEELVGAGNQFFGQLSAGLASVVEKAVAQYGQPNGYILGQEGTGAIFGGLRYGEGTLFTRNAGNLKVFWQGPTFGLDLGADGARTMILVYDLPSVDAIYRRFAGVDGSAYVVGGFGMTAMRSDDIVLVPVRSGVGARLGINVGYLKFTPQPTWNPF